MCLHSPKAIGRAKEASRVNENAQTERTPLWPATRTAVLESMHRLLLEALRHNEQEL